MSVLVDGTKRTEDDGARGTMAPEWSYMAHNCVMQPHHKLFIAGGTKRVVCARAQKRGKQRERAT